MKKTWHQFYDKGVPFEIEPPEDPLHRQLEKAARDFPQVTATEFVGSRLTYQQLADHGIARSAPVSMSVFEGVFTI